MNSQSNRREFLVGAAAVVIAGPAAVKAHPIMFGVLDTAVTEDFTKAALKRLTIQVRYLTSVVEITMVEVPASGSESPLKLRQISPEEFYK